MDETIYGFYFRTKKLNSVKSGISTELFLFGLGIFFLFVILFIYQVADGPHHYAIGDRGNLLVIIPMLNSTGNVLKYVTFGDFFAFIHLYA